MFHLGQLRLIGWTGDREGKTRHLLVTVVLVAVNTAQEAGRKSGSQSHQES